MQILLHLHLLLLLLVRLHHGLPVGQPQQIPGDPESDVASGCNPNCSKIRKPVCGTDGKTYSNLCLLELTDCLRESESGDGRVAVAFNGQCDDKMRDGNPAEEESDEASTRDPEAIDFPKCDEVCVKTNEPVCGDNGVTYGNLCELQAANCAQQDEDAPAIQWMHDGACQDRRATTADDDDLDQEAENDNDAAEAVGLDCMKQFKCTKILEPVCGSDGQTYNNECLLDLASCMISQMDEDQRNRVEVAYAGPCERDADDDVEMENLEDGEQSNDENGQADATKDEEQSLEEQCNQRYECLNVVRPVCGIDGRSYQNLCMLKLSSCLAGEDAVVDVFAMEPCEGDNEEFTVDELDEDCPTVCPAIYAPVCGNDGVTYGNDCELKAAVCTTGIKVFMEYEGPCIEEEEQGQDENQEQGGEDIVPPSVLVDPNECPLICPANFAPVCGSNGITYPNECDLMAKSCVAEEKISKVSDGPCDDATESSDDSEVQGMTTTESAVQQEEDTTTTGEEVEADEMEEKKDCPTFCPASYAPICGSDGRTYSNDCKLQVHICITGEKVTKASEGPCPAEEEMEVNTDCPTFCPLILKPVCGSDGKTYDNECMLGVTACKNEDDTLEKVKDGSCVSEDEQEASGKVQNCPKVCPLIFKQVCGSDGKTYDNACVLKSAACKRDDPSLVKAHSGPCPEAEEENLNEEESDEITTPEGDHEQVQGQVDENEEEQPEEEETTKADFEQTTLPEESHSDETDADEEYQDELETTESSDYVEDINAELEDEEYDSFASDIEGVEVYEVSKERPKDPITKFFKRSADTDCPTVCTHDYRPVCGSDGEVYSNECRLRVKACSSDEFRELVEVESNLCEDLTEDNSSSDDSEDDAIGSENIEAVLHEDDCPKICTLENRPVCGSDGEIYNNKCQLKYKACQSQEHAGLVEVDMSNCESGEDNKPETSAVEADRKCPKICTFEYKPVCANNGKVYNNKCEMNVDACETGEDLKEVDKSNCPSLDSKSAGESKKRVCPDACILSYEPVCGSDGKTYSNECQLKHQACKKNIDSLSIKHQGECKKESDGILVRTTPNPFDDDTSCPKFCTFDISPVCGSDGKTYTNECKLKVKACSNKDFKDLVKVSDGRCEQKESNLPKIGGLKNLAAISSSKTGISAIGTDELEQESQETEAKCPKLCSTLPQPVCGSDGVSYENVCFLEKARCSGKPSLRVEHEGECDIKCPVECQTEADDLQVCGSDGVTHESACEMQKRSCEIQEKISEVHKGPCQEIRIEQSDSCPLICTSDIREVCGSDGVTYINECHLKGKACTENQNLNFAYDGPCRDQESPCQFGCLKPSRPVCGSDGETYEDICALKKKACEQGLALVMTNVGICPTEDRPRDCPEQCPEDYSPVCGSDGVTYDNECALRVAACLTNGPNKKLEIVMTGACPVDETHFAGETSRSADGCQLECNKALSPVCGSDGQTYMNLCLLHRTACLENREIELIDNAPCRASDETEDDSCEDCTKELRPVCGTDGKTYSNLCTLNRTACLNKDTSLKEDYTGPCRDQKGPADRSRR